MARRSKSSALFFPPVTARRWNEVTKRLMWWGSRNLVRYPWRTTRSPYRILVAEILLQRTSADQVLPVYRQFVQKFPNPQKLADASKIEILGVIGPLGLSYRAGRLKTAARDAVRLGGVPVERNRLLQINGVGNYIANAVACFATGERLPLVDS